MLQAGRASFDNATAKIPDLNVWFACFVGSAGSAFPPGSQEEQQLFNFLELYLHQPTPKDRMARSFPDRVLHMGKAYSSSLSHCADIYSVVLDAPVLRCLVLSSTVLTAPPRCAVSCASYAYTHVSCHVYVMSCM